MKRHFRAMLCSILVLAFAVSVCSCTVVGQMLTTENNEPKETVENSEKIADTEKTEKPNETKNPNGAKAPDETPKNDSKPFKTITLTDGKSKSIDLNNDGKKETVNVNDSANGMTITNKKGKVLYERKGSEEDEVESMTVYIMDMCSTDGMLEVVMRYDIMSSDFMIEIVHLNAENKIEPVEIEMERESFEAYLACEIEIVEGKILLSVVRDILGTNVMEVPMGYDESGNRLYMLDEPMTFAANTEVVLAQKITATFEEGEEELKKGTKLFAVETDMTSYVKFRTEDDRYCTMTCTSEDYLYSLNGIHQDELFEELLYAG